jgi:hypothetical protein
MMERKRIFNVLPDGKVQCNLSCKVGSTYNNLAYIDGDSNVCIAAETPLIDGGWLGRSTLMIKGRFRVCALVASVTGKVEEKE